MPASSFPLYTPLLGVLSARTQQLACIGSPLVVANANSKATQGSYIKDPYNILLGTGGNHANVRILQIDEGSYLEVYHIFTGTTDPSTQPIIRAFGLKPQPQLERRIEPNDVDSANFTANNRQSGLNVAATFGDCRGMWVPLIDPVDLSPTRTFGAYASGITGAGGWSIAGPVRFFLGGVTKAMIVVDTAAVGPTAGMLMAGIVG